MSEPKGFLSLRFLALNACYFSLCCTLAAFFSLQSYIESLGIERGWNGLLMGAIGLGALAARPFLAHRLNTLKSCLVCLGLSSCALLAALASYLICADFLSLLAARLFNGFGFAGVFCAVVALSPHSFESARSGRAFSIISMACLLPFLTLPPFLGWLQTALGSFGLMLLSSGLPLAVSAPLAIYAFARHEENLRAPLSTEKAPGLFQSLKAFRRGWLPLAMGATFSFYFSYAWVFYNADSLCKAGGMANPGFLLSLATLCAIGFRLLAHSLLDGPWRNYLLISALFLNSAATLLLALSPLPVWLYYGVFAAFGLAWGAAVPLLLSAVMDRSEREAQGFNLNMASQMQDLGYFLGPLLGGGLKLGFLVSFGGALVAAKAFKGALKGKG
jgi:MFS family permease